MALILVPEEEDVAELILEITSEILSVLFTATEIASLLAVLPSVTPILIFNVPSAVSPRSCMVVLDEILVAVAPLASASFPPVIYAVDARLVTERLCEAFIAVSPVTTVTALVLDAVVVFLL